MKSVKLFSQTVTRSLVDMNTLKWTIGTGTVILGFLYVCQFGDDMLA